MNKISINPKNIMIVILLCFCGWSIWYKIKNPQTIDFIDFVSFAGCGASLILGCAIILTICLLAITGGLNHWFDFEINFKRNKNGRNT